VRAAEIVDDVGSGDQYGVLLLLHLGADQRICC
jgi:hypothetical protein